MYDIDKRSPAENHVMFLVENLRVYDFVLPFTVMVDVTLKLFI